MCVVCCLIPRLLRRCLKSLGEWQRLYTLAEEAWSLDPSVLPQSKVAPLGARAAWALGKWDSMMRFVSKTHEGDLQVGSFASFLFWHPHPVWLALLPSVCVLARFVS